VLSPTANDDESDDARTVLGSDTVDLPLRPVTTAKVDDRATPNITEVAMGAPGLTRSVPNLEVAEITAYSLVDYTAELNNEHSLKRSEEIIDVLRLSRSRYGGRIIQNSGVLRMVGITRAIWGHFDRANVILKFKLRHPLKVRTIEAFSSPYDGYVSYSKGEIFTINVS
jgi:hypothetical protein